MVVKSLKRYPPLPLQSSGAIWYAATCQQGLSSQLKYLFPSRALHVQAATQCFYLFTGCLCLKFSEVGRGKKEEKALLLYEQLTFVVISWGSLLEFLPSEIRRAEISKGFFLVVGPKLWNSLPKETCSLRSHLPPWVQDPPFLPNVLMFLYLYFNSCLNCLIMFWVALIVFKIETYYVCLNVLATLVAVMRPQWQSIIL